MNPPAKPWGRQTLALLRAGPFRRYLIGTSISDTGTWMQMMAQGWIMSTLTTKALMLGLVNFASGVPMIFLTMIGGAIADRGDKRKILVVTQVVQILFAVLLGWLIYSHRIAIWQIIAVAALLGTAFAFEMPALSALVPELVKAEEIASAVALDRAVFHGSRLMGPALAGIVVAAWGTAAAFFINAFTFVAFIFSLISLPPRARGSHEEEAKRASGIKDGFRYVWNDAPSLAMVGLNAMMTIFIFPTVSVMMPLYVRDVLALGPDKLGYIMAAAGFGSICGAILLIMVPRPQRAASMIAAAIAGSGAVFAFSRAHGTPVAAASLLLSSLGISFIYGMGSTIVQERAPNYLRGRVSAVLGLSFFGLMPVAGLGGTSVADAIGMRAALAGSALCYLLVSLGILFSIRHRLSEAPPPVEESATVTPEVASV